MQKIPQPFRQITLLLLLSLLAVGCASKGPPRTGGSKPVDEQTALFQILVQRTGGPWVLDPELETYVQTVAEGLLTPEQKSAEKFSFSIINSDEENALAFPNGTIAITRGLLANLDNEAQLAMVLAHEIVHAEQRHGIKQNRRASIVRNLALPLDGVLAVFGVRSRPIGGALGALTAGSYSRGAELNADSGGLAKIFSAGYKTSAATKLMRSFIEQEAEDNNDDEEPAAEESLVGKLLASHPPTEIRLEKIDALATAWAATTDYQGELKTSVFRRKTKVLNQLEEANELKDTAIEQFGEDQLKAGLKTIGKAIKLQPGDPELHVVEGLLYQRMDNFKAAQKSYGLAHKQSPDWYLPSLLTGLLHETQENYNASNKALAASVKLYPTRSAMESLPRVRALAD